MFALGLTCLVGAAAPASASLIFDVTIPVSGAGFGNIPRDLTFQGSGNPGYTESGCVGISAAGAITFTCMGADAAFDPNGVTDLGGDDVNPLADNQKYGIPTAASLGITAANQIQIIVDFTEPSGDHANVTDLTLKFYRRDNLTNTTTLIGSIDGSHDFPTTIPGNGQAGFAFVVSQPEWAYVNGLLAQGNISFALESTVTDAGGGPESYFIRNSGAAPVPEPASLVLFGSGLAAVVRTLRKKRAA